MQTPDGREYEITKAWANGNEAISIGLLNGELVILQIREAARLSVMLAAAVQEALEALKADVDEILTGEIDDEV
jgi:hypothetical protein